MTGDHFNDHDQAPPELGATIAPETPLAHMARRLDPLIAAVFRRYCEFAGRELPEEPRECGQYHAACRAALAHLEQLIKLARLVDGGTAPAAQPPEDLEDLMARAAAALRNAADG